MLPAGGMGTMAAAVALLGQQLDVTVVINSSQRLPNGSTGSSTRRSGCHSASSRSGRSPAPPPTSKTCSIPTTTWSSTTPPSVSTLDIEELPDDGECITERIRRAEGDFNRNDPSNWFLSNRKTASFVLRPTTLDRFERLFQAINATLG